LTLVLNRSACLLGASLAVASELRLILISGQRVQIFDELIDFVVLKGMFGETVFAVLEKSASRTNRPSYK
jgi:hypothetical protein